MGFIAICGLNVAVMSIAAEANVREVVGENEAPHIRKQAGATKTHVHVLVFELK